MTPKTATSSCADLRDAIRSHKFSEEINTIIMQSWRAGTISKYNQILQRWQSFCVEQNTDPLYTNVNIILKFLLSMYKGGCHYSGLCAVRSALSSAIEIPGYDCISENPMISRFLKGVYNKHPPMPKYAEIWDINIVLDYYEKQKTTES